MKTVNLQFILILAVALFISSCGNKADRFKGEYPTEFGNNDPAINIKFKTRKAFNGKTEFDLGWVKFSDMLTKDDSKLDETELEIGKTFLHRTVGIFPGVLVDPEPQPDYYRIYFPLGSRLVILTEQEAKGVYKFSSYPLGEMETPACFFVDGTGGCYSNKNKSEGCEDQLKWDLVGKISKNNLLLQVDFHWNIVAPNKTPEVEAQMCVNDLQIALAEKEFNPAAIDSSKVSNYYQIWYLIIRSQLPEVDPLEMYLQINSLDISVQVAGVRKFNSRWN